MRTAVALILLLLLSSYSAADDRLAVGAVKHGYSYLHVREATNNNDHPDIDKFLKYLGLPKGLSWCAAYSLYCFKESSDELRVKQPFPKYGRVAMLRQACINNPLKYRYITADEVRFGSVQLRPGDLPLWASGVIRAGDFNGHTGLVVQQLSPRTFHSIEGNTMPSAKGNQREGGGVYERNREIAPGNFRILGFCRVR